MPIDPKTQLDRWVRQIDRVADAVVHLGGERHELRQITPPVSVAEVAAVERRIRQRIPASYRTFLTQQASTLILSWWLPHGGKDLPPPLKNLFAGGCDFSFAGIEAGEKDRRGWIESCFPNPDDPYDRVWHNKLSLAAVGNGDHLAFDLSTGDDAAVVYLSHECGDGHGRRMANSFADLMNRWCPLGCPGSDDSGWLPFCGGPNRLIDPNGPVAQAWMRWLAL